VAEQCVLKNGFSRLANQNVPRIATQAAIAGAISEWGMDAGVLDQPLTHIQSLHVFNELAEQIKQLDTFQQHNARGKNMYSAARNQYAAK